MLHPQDTAGALTELPGGRVGPEPASEVERQGVPSVERYPVVGQDGPVVVVGVVRFLRRPLFRVV